MESEVVVAARRGSIGSLTASYQDRSVSEIEDNFSQHFVATEEDDSSSSSSMGFPSSSFDFLAPLPSSPPPPLPSSPPHPLTSHRSPHLTETYEDAPLSSCLVNVELVPKHSTHSKHSEDDKTEHAKEEETKHSSVEKSKHGGGEVRDTDVSRVMTAPPFGAGSLLPHHNEGTDGEEPSSQSTSLLPVLPPDFRSRRQLQASLSRCFVPHSPLRSRPTSPRGRETPSRPCRRHQRSSPMSATQPSQRRPIDSPSNSSWI